MRMGTDRCLRHVSPHELADEYPELMAALKKGLGASSKVELKIAVLVLHVASKLVRCPNLWSRIQASELMSSQVNAFGSYPAPG